jgi:uroporphyrinogen decarboxylase
VISAIAHKNTEPIPHDIDLTIPVAQKLCGHLGLKHEDLWDWFDNHIQEAKYKKNEYIEPDIFQDHFGVLWDRSIDKDIGVIKEYILKEPEIGSYRVPEPDLDFVDDVTVKMLESNKDSYKFGKLGFSLFERAWSLRGFENFLGDLAGEEKFVCELFEQILDYNMKVIDHVLAYYPVDGFFFGDDYGQQRGLLMSPAAWRKFIKPRLKKMFDKVKLTGRTVALHSCGNLSDILGDLIDIGLDVYQTVQPEIYDLKELKKEFGEHLTFWGGISTQKTLPYVSPDEVKKITGETIKILGKGGGYIAAPTHQVPPDVPVENILALLEAFREQ